MTIWSGKSIRAKLLITVGIAVASGIFLASVASALRETDRRFDSKRSEIASIGAALAASVAPYMTVKDRPRIAATINAIGRMPSITYARVRDGDGRVAYEIGSGIVLNRPGQTRTVNQDIGPWAAVYLGTYPYAVEILDAGSAVGTLELIADLSELRVALIESLLQSFAVGIVAALLGMTVSYGFQRSITGPIAELTATMSEVRQGHDFTRTVTRRSDDEVGKLVDAFNGMLSDIRTRDEQLARHRAGLEDEIRARTAELIEAKQAAEGANAAKTEFLATMSHEIRTPMNGMLVMAEILSASGLPPRLQRLSDVIVKSGNGLLAIINDILDFSKIEAGKLELEHVPLDPAALVDDALRLFAEPAASKGLDLSAYIATNVPKSVAADPVRLSQILTNLINNALKFTESGHVSLRLTSQATVADDEKRAVLTLSVSDTGIGIPTDKCEAIFGSFAQADSSTTRSYGGTGIGLTICRRLVDKMGGELTVASKVGKGSRFTVMVPVEVLTAAEPLNETSTPARKSVLIVMAPSPTREALLNYVHDAGFVGKCTDCGDLAAYSSTRADVVLAEAEFLPTIISSLSDTLPEIVLAITSLGDAPVNPRLGAAITAVELQHPICSGDIRPLFASIASGPEAFRAYILATKARDRTEPSSFQGVRVLAADDSAVNREVLVEALGRLDVDVTCVEDGAAAVEAEREGTFDLIFMDGSMPILDGYDAARAIRRRQLADDRKRTPIVALTAHVVGDHANQWRDAGMDDCVTKPFTLAALEECLTRHLGSPAKGADMNKTDSQEENKPDDCNGDAAAALLDETVLDSIREIQQPDNDLVGRVIGLYASHAPEALDRLLALNRDAQDQEIASAAHALKSLSRNVGAFQVGNLCDKIEAKAHDGDPTIFDADRVLLTDAVNSTIAALAQYHDEQS